MTKKPNFICVGAQKSGTTTLHDILKQHPKIYLPVNKETKYFQDDRRYEQGIEFYKNKFFNSYNGEKCLGEIDPDYMYFEYVPKRIFETLGKEVKLIFMLRNPASRAYSHYLMSLKRGYETLPFEEAIKIEKSRIESNDDYLNYKSKKNNLSYIDRGFYAAQINRFLEFFSIQNMFFIVFEEDFLNNRKQTTQELLKFLNVSADFDFNVDTKSNPATKPRSETVRDLLYKPSLVSKAGKFLIPNAGVRRLIKQSIDTINQKENLSKLTNELQRSIIETYYSDDIKQLEKLIGRDLSVWLR